MTPLPLLPLMTLPAPVVVPPIVLFDAPLLISTPSLAFAKAPVPAAVLQIGERIRHVLERLAKDDGVVGLGLELHVGEDARACVDATAARVART